jgi:predicted acetyltransferase
VLAAHEALAAEDFTFALDYAPGMAWGDYLDLLETRRRGRGLPADRVPATFLVADVDGRMVGRVSVRHRLNDWLLHEGGHIGYAVVPGERRKGYATDILRHGLAVARAAGVSDVLVCCDEGNVASSTVIVRGGGRLESTVVGSSGRRVERYWIRAAPDGAPRG